VHANSIVPWIWVIVVAIGIVNSIRKKAAGGAGSAQAVADRSAAAAEAELRKQAYFEAIAQQRRAAATAQAAVAPRAPLPPPIAPQQTTGAIARAASAAIPAAVARPAPPPRVEAPVAPSAPTGPDPILPHPSLVRRRTGVFAGMFEHRKGILRAIVAAEVLGKPKALAEHPFWSPPPTERSTSHS
jgi:hypothetical protein